MDESQSIQPEICQIHNLAEEFENPDKSKDKKFICRFCIDSFHGIISIQQLKKENEFIIKQFDQQIYQNKNQMGLLKHSLISLKEALNKQITNIQGIILSIINRIDSLDEQIQNAKSKNKLINKEDIKKEHQKYLDGQIGFQRSIIDQIQVMKQDKWIDEMVHIMRKMELIHLNYGDAEQKQEESIERELVPSFSIKQKNTCHAFAYNQDATMVAVGCWGQIKIFELKNGQLIELKSFEGHQCQITTLQFLKNSNQLISGSFDKQIKIWNYENNNQWINKQTLTDHSGWILCQITNSKEDLMVSSCREKSLIFWQLQNNEWCIAQSFKSNDIVWSVSLNKSNNKLVSSYDNGQINVFIQQGNLWSIIQNIKVIDFGFRLCFIDDEQFVYLPQKSQELHFYLFDEEKREFYKVSQLEIKNSDDDQDGFPIQLVQQKNLLIVKNGDYVNIIRKQNNGFIFDNTIKFDSVQLYGSVSEDGQFMITYDKNSEEIQIRKLNYII